MIEHNEMVRKIKEHKNWYHSVKISEDIITPGMRDPYPLLEDLNLPKHLEGLRVLDIGTKDGFFAFELEKRGAKEVIAIDICPIDQTGFLILKEFFDSTKTKYYTDNVYNLSKDNYGEFDIVLCLGLLYHLRNPLLALDRIREVCNNKFYVESFVIDNNFISKDLLITKLEDISEDLLNIPLMQFYPSNELNNDFTNWSGPNSICLEKMLESSNFTVKNKKVAGDRAIFYCAINDDEKTHYYRKIEKGILI